MLRVLPGMQVVCPGDRWETRAALRAILAQSAPAYLRLGKKGEPEVHSREPDFTIGQGIRLRTGSDASLLSTGNMLPIAMEAAALLEQDHGIACGVVSLHTVKPLDTALLGECFGSTRLVVTLEEHSVQGGLGGSVAEWLADQPAASARLLRVGTGDRFLSAAGDQAYARAQYGLDAPAVASSVVAAFERLAEQAQ